MLTVLEGVTTKLHELTILHLFFKILPPFIGGFQKELHDCFWIYLFKTLFFRRFTCMKPFVYDISVSDGKNFLLHTDPSIFQN